MNDSTPGLQMLAIADMAMQELNAVTRSAAGMTDLKALDAHRTTVLALFAEDGPVQRFNILADQAGVPVVTEKSSLWSCFHIDVVTEMVGLATTVLCGDPG